LSINDAIGENFPPPELKLWLAGLFFSIKTTILFYFYCSFLIY